MCLAPTGSIAEGVAGIQERIRLAVQRAGRELDDVQCMAVTKTVDADRIREAYACGLRLFGENRVQEFSMKASQLRDLVDSSWHMIGHLQTNKAARAAEVFDAVDSVDSVRLARKLNEAASALGKTLPVLIEINIGGEAAKSGVDPQSPELNQLLLSSKELTSLDLQGLLTVPPYSEKPENSRAYFRKLRELLAEINGRELVKPMQVLSMGMSHDFAVAIEEGSTCVRLGTAIFGDRSPRSTV